MMGARAAARGVEEMKSAFQRALVFNATIILFSVSALSQMTVDATHPSHERTRQPTTGSGGGVGRKLPLQVIVEFRWPSPDGNGKAILEFALTNVGRTELTIPVSPNSGDFEPADDRGSYAVKSLALFINSDPGQKMRVLSGVMAVMPLQVPCFRLLQVNRFISSPILPTNMRSDEKNTMLFEGYAGLSEETIKTVNGKTSLDSREIGYSNSQEYNAHTLFGVPE
jgi:hypothetical protein